MNKKILKIFMSISLLSLIMTGCGQVKNSDSSGQTSTSDSVSGSVTPSNPSNSNNPTPSTSNSADADVEYNISILPVSNATVTTDKQKAKKGEVVTITIDVNDGYIINSVKVNNSEISPTGNKYVFAMPATDAYISVTIELFDKDGLTIGGDIAAKLEEVGNGIYVAKNIAVPQDSHVYYSTDGVNQLSCTQVNRQKSFADLEVTQGNGFKIAGNAIYDFYYDEKDKGTPCYVIRTGLINLPNSEASLAALFSVGGLVGEDTLNPTDINKVEYTSTTRDENYTWELYENGSLATITNTRDTSTVKSFVYKNRDLDNNVYTLVDTFGGYQDGAERHCLDDHYDQKRISAHYDIAYSGKNSFTSEEVDKDISVYYAHNMYDLDREMKDAYRNSYVGNDGVKHTSSVTSTVIDENSKDFKTTLFSTIELEDSTSPTHIEYELEVTFDKAGKLKEGSYTETLYDETSYNFKTGQKIDPNVTPTKDTTFKYSYGNKKTGSPTYDVSPYFVSEISNITIVKRHEEDKVLADNKLLIGSELSCGSSSSTYLVKFDYLPATALDVWQYSLTSSSNPLVVGPRNSSYPTEFRAFDDGTAEITISNNTLNSSNVKEKFNVTVVDDGWIKQLYMYTNYPYAGYDDTFGANNGIVVCGRSYTLQLCAKTTSNTNVFNHLGLSDDTITVSPAIIDVHYDDETGQITFDATNSNVNADTSVTVTLNSIYQSSDWDFAQTISLHVLPREEFEDGIVGNTYEESDGRSTIVFVDESHGVIHYIGSLGTMDFNFDYAYDNATGNITISNIDKHDYIFLTCKMFFDPDSQELLVYLVGETVGTGGWEDQIVDEFLGAVYADDEGFEELYYQPFTKKS